MPGVIALHLSDNDLTATLTDENGDGVTGATVTVTIEDEDGSAVATDEAMSEDGGGDYTYRIEPDLLTETKHEYVAKVKAVLGNLQRYAEVIVFNVADSD